MDTFSAVLQFVLRLVVIVWIGFLIYICFYAKDYVFNILKIILRAMGFAWFAMFLFGALYYIFSDESKMYVLPLFIMAFVGLLPAYIFRKKQEKENLHSNRID